jgi:hypothetical protein
MMVIHESGFIKGVPVAWHLEETSSPSANDPLHDAVLVTAHTDTIIITTDLHSRSFIIVTKGQITKSMSAAKLLTFLEQEILSTSVRRNDHAMSTTHYQ